MMDPREQALDLVLQTFNGDTNMLLHGLAARMSKQQQHHQETGGILQGFLPIISCSSSSSTTSSITTTTSSPSSPPTVAHAVVAPATFNNNHTNGTNNGTTNISGTNNNNNNAPSSPKQGVPCKFAEACVNYTCNRSHPPGRRQPCRYGDDCKRHGCIFLHPTRGQSPPPTPNASTQECRFGLACVNFHCNRQHPAGRRQACRLAERCVSQACPFLHPKHGSGVAGPHTPQSHPASSDDESSYHADGGAAPARRLSFESSSAAKSSFVPLHMSTAAPVMAPSPLAQHIFRPQPAPMATAQCVRCGAHTPARRSVACAAGHVTCSGCLHQHVLRVGEQCKGVDSLYGALACPMQEHSGCRCTLTAATPNLVALVDEFPLAKELRANVTDAINWDTRVQAAKAGKLAPIGAPPRNKAVHSAIPRI